MVVHVVGAVSGKIQPDHTVENIQRAGAQIDVFIHKTQHLELLQYRHDILQRNKCGIRIWLW
jgi:hypothetical protein